ncbi:MAG: hypothetical protein KIT22_08650 [Verrucomicrobiae bacterium]|nr:hypothetical protein [Verrucomicrobiae bacterium]
MPIPNSPLSRPAYSASGLGMLGHVVTIINASKNAKPANKLEIKAGVRVSTRHEHTHQITEASANNSAAITSRDISAKSSWRTGSEISS